MNKKEEAFVQRVWEHYHRAGRHRLPWRRTRDPYRILVSELMLQQTQVDRVIPKYREFLERFPTAVALANAPLGEVLRSWQGLGYNRRAKYLHSAAKSVKVHHRGIVPRSYEELLQLPGIGPYTAAAVMTFAYNKPFPLIETNIRSAYLHHFFNDEVDVSDATLLVRIHSTLDRERPREWCYALMDYGSYIKKTYGNPNGRSKHYARQSTFKNSDRQIRGAILRAVQAVPISRKKLHANLPFDPDRIDAQLYALMHEGLIEKTGRLFSLPTT